MLGDTSEFGPLDLLGALSLNAVTTHMACQRPEFRIGFPTPWAEAGADGKKPVKAVTDYRFLGGMAAAVVGQFSPGAGTRRVSHDLAVGLLGSFVATEVCRKHATSRIENGQTNQRVIADTPEPGPQAETEGSPAYYGYGW